MAFASRCDSDRMSIGATAPAACWALNVTILDAVDIAKSGSFSTNSGPSLGFLAGGCLSIQNRLSGQTSSSKRTNGGVTSIGLLNRLKPKKQTTHPYRPNEGLPAYLM